MSTRAIALAIATLAACSHPGGTAIDATPPQDVGPDGPPQIGCTAMTPRTVPLQAFVGFTGLEARVEAAIDAATTSLDLQMYLFTVKDVYNKVIAAHARGVAVRVLMDPGEAGNATAKSAFASAGVQERDTPSQYAFAHAKYMIVDHTSALVMSGNFNAGAFSSERNYGFIDGDAEDIADLQAIFEDDWGGGSTPPDMSCTRLIVSPVNSRQRELQLIDSATTTLNVEALYVDDTNIQAAIIAAANHGVAVQVILAASDDESTIDNSMTVATFKAASIPVHYAESFDCHAKLIVADGVAFVGSENMSLTSFTMNREVGELVFEPDQAALIEAQFTTDWANTVAQ